LGLLEVYPYALSAQQDMQPFIAEPVLSAGKFAQLLAKRRIIVARGTETHAFAIGANDRPRR